MWHTCIQSDQSSDARCICFKVSVCIKMWRHRPRSRALKPGLIRFFFIQNSIFLSQIPLEFLQTIQIPPQPYQPNTIVLAFEEYSIYSFLFSITYLLYNLLKVFSYRIWIQWHKRLFQPKTFNSWIWNWAARQIDFLALWWEANSRVQLFHG